MAAESVWRSTESHRARRPRRNLKASAQGGPRLARGLGPHPAAARVRFAGPNGSARAKMTGGRLASAGAPATPTGSSLRGGDLALAGTRARRAMARVLVRDTRSALSDEWLGQGAGRSARSAAPAYACGRRGALGRGRKGGRALHGPDRAARPGRGSEFAARALRIPPPPPRPPQKKRSLPVDLSVRLSFHQ